MADPFPPQVYLVGAGPGDPGMLTLRAVEALGRADLVLYDRLVSRRILDHAPARAERVCVADLAEQYVDRYPLIHAALVAGARAGKVVVRLKGGDPFVYGRGGEEAEALVAAGIPFEVVPGVTAGLGAASHAGIPLTHRLHSSAVAFVTGHEAPDKDALLLDWEALARFPGTLVVYMAMAHVEAVVAALLRAGKPADTPAAAVHQATTGRQQTVTAPLTDLPGALRAARMAAPALLLIGSVVSLRSHLAWFEKRPLFGKRVLVTRPRQQAGDLARRLEELGAVVDLLPVIEIRDPADWSAVDAALGRLGEFQWLVFTSANGVHALVRRLRETGRDLRALGGLRLAAIGPSTSEALRNYQLDADLVPDEYRSESLAAALGQRAAGQRILLARADRGREILREELSAVAVVEQVAVYSQVDAVDEASPAIAALRRGEVDYVTCTSSNIVRALWGALDAATRERLKGGRPGLVSISPVTSTAIRELGLPVAAEAEEFAVEGLVAALVGAV
jgi:uroporphyrinogen III methyltransferase/synthase